MWSLGVVSCSPDTSRGYVDLKVPTRVAHYYYIKSLFSRLNCVLCFILMVFSVKHSQFQILVIVVERKTLMVTQI
jgi:hypothetical protein